MTEIRRWYFEIPGPPKGRTNPAAFGFIDRAGKARARQVQTKVTRSFEASVAEAARIAFAGEPLLEGPFVMDLIAVFPRSLELDKPYQPDELIILSSKPDRDNIEKAVQDGMKAIWRDDCRVAIGTTAKAYAERGGKPRTMVWLRTLAPDEQIEIQGVTVTMPASEARKQAYRDRAKEARAADRAARKANR